MNIAIIDTTRYVYGTPVLRTMNGRAIEASAAPMGTPACLIPILVRCSG
nr:hypothetical protein [Ferroplasma sp. Type II]